MREVVLVPSTLQEEPIADDSVRPGGIGCRIQAWEPHTWYPHTPPNLDLVLSEYADVGGEHTYFKVANPRDPVLVDDELINIDLREAE